MYSMGLEIVFTVFQAQRLYLLYSRLRDCIHCIPGLEIVFTVFHGLRHCIHCAPGLEIVCTVFHGLRDCIHCIPGLEIVFTVFHGLRDCIHCIPDKTVFLDKTVFQVGARNRFAMMSSSFFTFLQKM